MSEGDGLLDPFFKMANDTADKVALADKAGMDTKISFTPSGKALLIYFIPAIVITIISANANAHNDRQFGDWIGYGIGWTAILAIPAYLGLLFIRYNRKVPQTKEQLQQDVLRKGYDAKTWSSDDKLSDRLNRKKDNEF